MTQESTASQPDQPATPGAPEATPPLPVADQPPPAPGAAAEPRPRRRGLAIALGVVAGVAVLAAAGVLVVTLLGGDVPEVGECLTNSTDPTEMEVVDCGAGQAAWEVIGHHRGSLTEDEFAQAGRGEICRAFPDWENALWLRTNVLTGAGQVVCLVPAGPDAPAE